LKPVDYVEVGRSVTRNFDIGVLGKITQRANNCTPVALTSGVECGKSLPSRGLVQSYIAQNVVY
jgi:hypothetical protein